MRLSQKIHCPNCGSSAERHYISDTQLVRTQCPTCDYLMINCTRTGKVIEAYAPGIYKPLRWHVSPEPVLESTSPA